MTFYQVNNNKNSCKRPFVEFSSNEDRAALMTAAGGGGGLPPRRRKRSKGPGRKKRSPRRRRTRSRVTKVRVVNGQVALRIGGRSGVQRLRASQVVRFVPLKNLRLAAQRLIGGGISKRGRRRRRARKRQH